MRLHSRVATQHASARPAFNEGSLVLGMVLNPGTSLGHLHGLVDCGLHVIDGGAQVAGRLRYIAAFRLAAHAAAGRLHVWQRNTTMEVPSLAYLASRMIKKLAVCRVMRPFVTTKVSVPNLTLEPADSHAHSTYAKSS